MKRWWITAECRSISQLQSPVVICTTKFSPCIYSIYVYMLGLGHTICWCRVFHEFVSDVSRTFQFTRSAEERSEIQKVNWNVDKVSSKINPWRTWHRPESQIKHFTTQRKSKISHIYTLYVEFAFHVEFTFYVEGLKIFVFKDEKQ